MNNNNEVKWWKFYRAGETDLFVIRSDLLIKASSLIKNMYDNQ